MATNEVRETSYFHCLIFHEMFAKELIHADFDEETAYQKLKNQVYVNKTRMDLYQLNNERGRVSNSSSMLNVDDEMVNARKLVDQSETMHQQMHNLKELTELT
jgi:hypothetical protein